MMLSYSRSVTELRVLEAIAYVFNKRRQMLDALRELGYSDVRDREPRRIQEYYDLLIKGLVTTIGTRDDPFVLTSKGKPVAHYWIEMSGDRCRVEPRGSEDFLAAYAQIAQRDSKSTVH